MAGRSMTSSERVARYRQKQREAGRRLVTLYLHPDTISKLRKLAKGHARGKVIERAVADLWRVSNNGGSVT